MSSMQTKSLQREQQSHAALITRHGCLLIIKVLLMGGEAERRSHLCPVKKSLQKRISALK